MSMKKESVDLSKGMVKQPNPLFTGNSTYYYALNAMLGSRQGDTGSLTNEEGNEICFTLPTITSVLIGHVLMDDNKSIVFAVDDNYSYIIEFDPDTCTSSTLIRSACLNFKSYKQIDALYRNVRGCERIIYFTDGYNPYRSINIDTLKDYLNPGFADVAAANADPANGWNCILFNHFASHNVPCIDLRAVIDSNSTLKPGVVQFAIRYIDSSSNPTRWIYITNPIPLYNENMSSVSDLIDGDEPFSQIDLNYVNKAITLSISDLDINFKYYQLAAIESNQGLGTVTDVVLLDRQSITNVTTSNFTYYGFNPNIHTLTTIDEITINGINIDTVETHAQIDDRLITANVKTFTEDWATLQRAVLLTDVKWETSTFLVGPVNSNPSGNTKNPHYHYETMTYMRDEVYALGIVFVFENGLESPVFHIPGRAPNTYYGRDYNNGLFTIQSGDDITDDIVTNLDTVVGTNQNNHYRDGGITAAGGSGVSTLWDTQPLTVVHDGSMIISDAFNQVEYSNIAHLPLSEFNNACSSGCGSLNANLSITVNPNGGDPANSLDLTVTTSLVGDWRANVRISIFESLMDISGAILEDAVLPLAILLSDVLLEFNNGAATITVSAPGHAVVTAGPDSYLVFTAAVSLYSITNNCGGPMTSLIHGQSVNFNKTYPFIIRPNGVLSGGPPFSTTYTTVYTDEIQTHIGCTIPRWKVYNTAININPLYNLNITGSSNDSVGLMGYYEGTTTYPTAISCDGLSIWDATSIGGFDLSLSKIRHHRFPDLNLAGQNLVHAVTELNTSLLSIRFDLTDVYANIPINIESKIIGHYIVRADRTDFDKTILDKGFTFNGKGVKNNIPHLDDYDNFTEASFYRGGWAAYSTSIEFISNDLLYNNKLNQGDYIKYEACTQSISTDVYRINSSFYGGYDGYFHRGLLHFNNYNENAKIRDCRYGVHRPIINSVVLPSLSQGESTITGGTLSSGLRPTKSGFYELNIPFLHSYPISGFTTIGYSSFSSVNDYSFIFYRTLSRLHLTDLVSYNKFRNNFGIRLNYVAIKVYKQVYEFLNAIKYIKTHNCMIDKINVISNVYGGDIFISESHVIKAWGYRVSSSDTREGGTISRFFSESTINSGLRYSDDWNSRYWPRYFYYPPILTFPPTAFEGVSYYLAMLGFTLDDGFEGQYEDDGGDLADVADYQRPFEYKYNIDYSKLNTDKTYFPLDDDFDYCDDCEGREEYSIYYSEKANITDVQDNYKVILASNFKIMPGESGTITNLFVEQDQLFCHTERALWALQTRPQQLDTNENTLFIGTGEFLSIPPKRLISTKYGYAGSTDKFATITTQFGTFFVDNEAGQVFQYSGQLKEISQVGMEQWFKKYLPLKFSKQYKDITGLDYTIRHTADKNAIGFQSAFDPRFKRLILHKKDYLMINPDTFILIAFGDPEPDPEMYTLYAVPGDPETDPEYIHWYYYNVDGEESTWVETDLNNTTYFENESFTISFSCDVNTWVSFHSYQPNLMFNNRNKFYSYINNATRDIWVHDERNYQTYYSVKYDHIIETIFNPDAAQEKIFDSVQYISNVYDYVSKDSRFINVETVTFDRFEISNNNQSSDNRNLIVKTGAYDSLSLTTVETLVDRTDNYWRFNRFRDMAHQRTSEPLFTTDWSVTNTFYDALGQGYVDSVINPLSINLTKPYYEQARFRDKVAFLRLYFNPTGEDYKISTEVISILIKPSLR